MIAILFLALFSACASDRQDEAVENRKAFTEMEGKLQPGMSLSEIRGQGFNVTNCRGKPDAPSICEVQGITAAGRTYPANMDRVVGKDLQYDDHPPQRGMGELSKYTLFFETGRLKSWQRGTHYIED